MSLQNIHMQYLNKKYLVLESIFLGDVIKCTAMFGKSIWSKLNEAWKVVCQLDRKYVKMLSEKVMS